jgi:hypothetical protein
MLDAGAMADVFRWTERYIVSGYFTKSLRCGECVVADRCRGMHISYVRAHGYAPMRPITGAT